MKRQELKNLLLIAVTPTTLTILALAYARQQFDWSTLAIVLALLPVWCVSLGVCILVIVTVAQISRLVTFRRR